MTNDAAPLPAAGEATSYDVVDYPGHARPDLHPGRLAAMGVLHGMEPAAVTHCRVLELGCGEGGNLLPMAYQLPDSRFVGIDLAALPIERGRGRAAALGLANVELQVMDICDATAALGQFDYIIAHGVYSWVPPAVRERLLALCATLLAPEGIAFISYLAQPGTQVRNVLRDFLLRYSDDLTDPAARIARARQLADALGGGSTAADPFQRAIQEAARELESWEDGQIFHDWLAPINAAVRFTDFIAEASRHGLGFLGEAEYFAMCWRQDPALSRAHPLLEAAETANVLLKEQLLDELRCRRFRQTLLRRAEVPWSSPTAERVLRLAASSRLRPVGEVDLAAHIEAEFRSPQDNAVRTDHPVAKAALVYLAQQYPRFVPGSELLEVSRSAAARTNPETAAADANVLGSVLLACVSAGQAQLTAWAPPFAAVAGERPRASAVARAELQRSSRITTLCHEGLSVRDPLGATLLGLLDGTRTRAELVVELMRLIDAGQLAAPPADDPAIDIRTRLEQGLERSLTGLARAPLLEA